MYLNFMGANNREPDCITVGYDFDFSRKKFKQTEKDQTAVLNLAEV